MTAPRQRPWWRDPRSMPPGMERPPPDPSWDRVLRLRVWLLAPVAAGTAAVFLVGGQWLVAALFAAAAVFLAGVLWVTRS